MQELLSFIDHNLILLAISLPLAGVFLIRLFGKFPNIRELATITTAIATFAIVFRIFWHFYYGEGVADYTVGKMFVGIDVAFKVEPLGLIFALVASFLWIVTTLYSIGYMRGNDEHNQTRFFMMFAFAISFALGIAFAKNLLTMFIFYEMLTLSTYPLVTHHQNSDAKKGGRVYIGILMSTSIGLFLPAIIWTFYIAGTTDFVFGGILSQASSFALAVLLVLYMYGIGKAALMPMHRWLPAAMVAPTPVSALLHAVAVVKAGVFCVVKIIVYVFGVDKLTALFDSNLGYSFNWLLYVSGATIILASIVALRQDSFKKRLAYSTISQLSYVIMAAAILAPKSLIAAAFHIAAHAAGKITLFFVAGAVYTASKKKYISELNGIGKRMPITMLAFSIGALSMIGLPPTAGFITKWYLLSGTITNEAWFALGVIILSTLLNAGYFLPIIYAAFFKKEDKVYKEHLEAPKFMVLAMIITATITVALFFVPDIFLGLGEQMLTSEESR